MGTPISKGFIASNRLVTKGFGLPVFLPTLYLTLPRVFSEGLTMEGFPEDAVVSGKLEEVTVQVSDDGAAEGGGTN